jgi:PAS domain S-box-containing protein
MADSLPTTEAHRRFRATLARGLMGALTFVSVGLAIAIAWMPPDRLSLVSRSMLIAGYVLIAAAGFALRSESTGRLQSYGLPAVTIGAFAVVFLEATVTGDGLYSPELAFVVLLVPALAVVAGTRRGVQAAAVAVIGLVIVALLEYSNWLGVSIPTTFRAVATVLCERIGVLGAALWGGIVTAQALDRTLRHGGERERRFLGLLAIAADAYWELDADGNLARFSAKDDLRAHVGFAEGPDRVLGKPLWETRGVVFDPQVEETFRSELAARLPMRDLPLRWTDVHGQHVRHFMLSAEPRFDDAARFTGYWGVLHDITMDVKARRALRSTETRYQDLFRRIPTPLVLHREARVLDANPAAVQLFGYADLRSMLGQDFVAAFEAGASREAARERMHALESLPVGEGLGEAEYTLRPTPGRTMVIRLSSVRVDVDGEAATLSIVIDDTERRQAEDLVRRSEALLSHLVATSPDAIALTEFPGGRYAMVNPTFLALTGYGMQEVLGRTAAELGLWTDAAQVERLQQALQAQTSAQNLPATLIARDGRRVQTVLSAARFTMDGIDYLMTSARDVTAAERTRLEREAILENALIGIAFTREQRFQMTNARFDEMFGWPHGALAGQPGQAVWPSSLAYEEMGRTVGPALGRGEQVDIEIEMMRRDGSTFMCRLLARALDLHRPGAGGTVWLAEDVTERRQVERALARARDEAEAANRAKSAFLANTSHEIRTPLNALLGLAQLARTPGVDDERRLQYIEQICDSAETLSAILSDILDLSKIEAGKLVLEDVGFDLGGLLQGLTQAYGALADTKGLQLRLDIGDDVPAHVCGDPIRLRQILSNYLTNALKFTSRGRIELVVRRLDPVGAGDRVRFEVRDTGDGMDAAALERLFQPFTQVDNSITRRIGGTGLGLSICRELAHLMGGDVGVESAPGHGSLFWAEVPLREAGEDEIGGPASGHGVDVLLGTRVLLVEDNAVNMMIAVALLERWGATVDQADDGPSAIAAVEAAATAGHPFDVVLMDVQMPGMSGHEVTRRLRRRWSRRELPVIALTAAALVSEREDALAAGMNDFLTKPIDASRLRSTLGRVLSVAQDLVEDSE